MLLVTVVLGIGLGVELSDQEMGSYLGSSVASMGNICVFLDGGRDQENLGNPPITGYPRQRIRTDVRNTSHSRGRTLCWTCRRAFVLAVVFALLSVQRLQKVRAYAVSQTLSVLAGIGIIMLLGENGKSLPAGMARQESRTAGEMRRPDAFDALPSSPSSDDDWLDAQKTVQKGNVQIEVTRVFVGKAPLKSYISGETGESKDPLCQISLRITNRASASKIDYRGWQDNSFSSDATLTDEIGNHYKGIDFEIGTHVVGRVESESLYPGKSLEELLVLKFRLRLPST